jgi:hypothetical protein
MGQARNGRAKGHADLVLTAMSKTGEALRLELSLAGEKSPRGRAVVHFPK